MMEVVTMVISTNPNSPRVDHQKCSTRRPESHRSAAHHSQSALMDQHQLLETWRSLSCPRAVVISTAYTHICIYIYNYIII